MRNELRKQRLGELRGAIGLGIEVADFSARVIFSPVDDIDAAIKFVNDPNVAGAAAVALALVTVYSVAKSLNAKQSADCSSPATLGSPSPGVAPKSGTLSNVDARKWYLEQESKILGEIDPNLPLRDRAVQAFNRRNELRTKARELMADRELAEKLMREEPNMTLRDLVKRKYQQKGLVGDELWQDILDSSQKSRSSVNKQLGLE